MDSIAGTGDTLTPLTRTQLLDLIQYAIEEGTGEPCNEVDAESILTDWRQAS